MTTPFLITTRTDLAHYIVGVTLDGSQYRLEFRWNTREESWYMHVRTSLDAEILDSIKVVADWPMAWNLADPALPPGLFYATDTSGASVDPGLEDLGDRVQLYYLSDS
jgi:hypothetical protein